MTLLLTCFAAAAATVIWYTNKKARTLRVGSLALMYWGASLMWLVDAAAEYIELRDAFFTPAAANMLNDTYLGLSVVALGLVIWLIAVLIRDPNGTVRQALLKKHG
ncbi:MAG: hypothetical protein IKQ91_11075 [Oscillospiraceae bacterium]|nr:hypothetical protein [Oscillospiraceae bacterium]